jgi:predicted regulator of Ras-like GTPase activity (Roadblock/LC7/MglB family)
MPKSETLKLALVGLCNALPELKVALLASNEGLPIANAITNGSDPNRVAAMAAAASPLEEAELLRV